MKSLRDIVSKIGSQSKTAKLLGVNQQNVQYHINNSKYPASWAATLSKATGIPVWEIRPDLYPKSLFKKEQ